MKKYAPLILIVGLLTLTVGLLLPIMSNNIENMTFRWVYAAGAALIMLSRFLTPAPPKSWPMRVRRLLRMEVWSSVLFCVAAGFAFYETTQIRDWLAFTLAGAALQIYTSIALTFAQRKIKQ